MAPADSVVTARSTSVVALRGSTREGAADTGVTTASASRTGRGSSWNIVLQSASMCSGRLTRARGNTPVTPAHLYARGHLGQPPRAQSVLRAASGLLMCWGPPMKHTNRHSARLTAPPKGRRTARMVSWPAGARGGGWGGRASMRGGSLLSPERAMLGGCAGPSSVRG